DRTQNVKIVLAGATLLLVLHGWGTHERNKIWSSEETLWKDVAEKSPKNGRGLMNYGLTFMRKGEYEEALKYFEKGLIYNPYYSYLYINTAVVKSALKRPDAEVENTYRLAVQYGSTYFGAYYYYGEWLKSKGRKQEALVQLETALNLGKQSLDVRYSLLDLYNELQMWDKMKSLAESTLKLAPGDPTALTYLEASGKKMTKLDIARETAKKNPTTDNWINLSLQYYNTGQYADCVDACNQALAIDPDNVLALNNMCSAWNALGEYDKAIAACEKALEIKPDYELARGNLNLANQKKALIPKN
ncbi:MAG: tetratricopeptide repeat protein, partial [Bacteroidetes bacterium]|nr:tetratricopeptide repeat protein [Bacteroidota bacterium]